MSCVVVRTYLQCGMWWAVKAQNEGQWQAVVNTVMLID